MEQNSGPMSSYEAGIGYRGRAKGRKGKQQWQDEGDGNDSLERESKGGKEISDGKKKVAMARREGYLWPQ